MPRGGPDWGNNLYQVAVNQTDIGALIAPIRGIAPVDGRGRIWLFETFKDTLSAWTLKNAAGGSDPAISSTIAEISPNSALLDAGATAGTGQSIMTHRCLPPGSPRQGIEFSLLYSTAAPDVGVELAIEHNGLWIQGYVLVQPSHNWIQIVTAGPTINVPIRPAWTNFPVWVPFKIVLDADLLHYVRMVIGPTEYDLSAYTVYSQPQNLTTQPDVEVGAFSGGGTRRLGYIGHVIATVDEP
jgi:hypothetical protein